MRIYILLLAACLCACKPASTSKSVSYPPPTRIVEPFEVLAALSGTNITASSFALPDAKYFIPTLRWIQSDFSNGFWQFKNEMGIATFQPEAWDCDKFAIAASFYAKWLNAASPNRNVSAGLCIGELFYRKHGDRTQGHAINFFVVLVGESLQIVCYEPQTHSVVTLTEAERRSVFFWKL